MSFHVLEVVQVALLLRRSTLRDQDVEAITPSNPRSRDDVRRVWRELRIEVESFSQNQD